jgi:hypothetical protein
MMNEQQTSPGKIFAQAYEDIEKIPFDDDWVNDEGYYDNIHGKVVVKIGEMKASYDDFAKKRLIFIGTRLGVICVYDKYPDQTTGGYHHVNVPDCKNKLLQVLIPAPTIGKRDMVVLLGSWKRYENNIGHKIEEIFEQMEEFA